MDKSLLKKSWILAGLLLVINVVIGLIILAVIEFFNIGSSVISFAAGIIGAMIVGQIYTANFREIMPKKLRINVIIIYTLVQMVIGSLYILVLGIPDFVLFLGILIAISLVYSLFVYWMLGSSGKMCLKVLENTEAAKRK